MAFTASVLAQQAAFTDSGPAQPAPLPAAPKAAAPSATDAGTNAPQSIVDQMDNFLGVKIPDAIAKGKFNVNMRLRYEQANEEGAPGITKNSYAPTLRTRFGFTTAPLYGFQGMVEGVNVTALGPEHNYNAGGSNAQGARPVVADPPLTRLDQAWFGYAYEDYVNAKVGEQRIVLDNHRFVGDVGWRQNMQTYDSATISSEPIKGLNLYYGYLWDVHRVYGDVSGLSTANEDFRSDSHLINISYSGWKYGKFVGYTYLLNLENAAGAANSSATYGGYFAGAAPISQKISVDYRAEFAYQTDYGDSLLRYDADYYNLELGATVDPFSFGGGIEDLGSGVNSGAGGGRASFRTPLATLHAFNGWDDVFLTTPANGLRDIYGYAQVMLPTKIPLRFVYHKYDADYGSGDYGQEFDAVISKKFAKHWNVLVKYAYYQGQDAPAPSLAVGNVDIQKFWAQLEFNF